MDGEGEAGSVFIWMIYVFFVGGVQAGFKGALQEQTKFFR